MLNVHLVQVGCKVLRPYPDELFAYVGTIDHLLESTNQCIPLWLLESYHVPCVHLFQKLLSHVVSEATHEIQQAFLYEAGLWEETQVESIVII